MNRAVSVVLLLLLIFCGTRLLIRALPGDPIDVLVAETGTRVPKPSLRNELHLDTPPGRAIFQDLIAAAQGDWGRSILSGEPIAPTLARRTARTGELAFATLLLALLVSVPLGLGAVFPSGNPIARGCDWVCSVHGSFMLALPAPWLGPALLYLFTIAIPIFPIRGSVWLPALTIALTLSGTWARLIRSRAREILAMGPSTAARARGLPEWKIVLKYGFAPALPALLAYLGTQIGFLLGGAFVAEVIFDWPGLGALLVDSVLRRDYPVIESGVFVAAAFSILGTLGGDWLQNRFDPRERSV